MSHKVIPNAEEEARASCGQIPSEYKPPTLEEYFLNIIRR